MKTALRYRLSVTIIMAFIYSCCIGCSHSQNTKQSENKQDTVSAFYHNATNLFDKGANLQRQGKYSEAITVYKELISLSPHAGLTSAQTQTGALVIDKGFLQLIYCYIYSEKRKDGTDFCKNIYYDNKLWFVQNYPRSVEIYMSYGFYEATEIDLAVEFLSRGLSRTEKGRTAEQIYVDNGIASAIYNQVGDLEQAITCGERCVEIIRTMDSKTDIVFPLGNLISQYQQIGEFEKALNAYEELIASGEGEKNPYAMCYAEDNIVQLFTEWGMSDEVKIHLNKELEAAKSSQMDEALIRAYTALFIEAFESGVDQRASAMLDSMALYLPDRNQPSYYHEVYDDFHTIMELKMSEKSQQTVYKSRRLLDKIKKEPAQNIPIMIGSMLGEILALKGEPYMALEAYGFCADYAQKNKKVHLQRVIYLQMGQLYATVGNYEASSSYLLKYHTAEQIFTQQRNAGMMLQFKVKYETIEKEKANELLLSQLELKERTVQYYAIMAMFVILGSLLFSFWLIMRQRAQREKIKIKIRSMLLERQILNQKNEELLTKLTTVDTQTDLYSLQQILSPRLLTQSEEQEFRRQFTLLHPTFTARLKKECPYISKGEELLSMMIKINLSSEEIAFALGNGKSSVNTSRFRFRKKLGLDKDISLDDFIHKL